MTSDLNNTVSVHITEGPALSGRSATLIQAAREHAQAGKRVLFVCDKASALEWVREQVGNTDEQGDEQGQQGTTSELARTQRQQNAASALACAQGQSSCTKSKQAISVTTPAQLALRILDTPEAQALYGRKPRLLEPYEEALLFEDMKVSQFKSRRLRKIRDYLYAGWANLSDDNWEQTYEEDLFIDRLRSNLRFTGGVLPCEAANLALHALRGNAGLVKQFAYDGVFVDDYDLLSRAAQHLAQALALEGFAISAGVEASVPVPQEPYPCFEGVAELKQTPTHKTRTTTLTSAQPKASLNPQVKMAASIEAELQTLAIEGNAALERGETVVIVGTHALWRKNLMANLSRVGLPVAMLPQASFKLKDFREGKNCNRAYCDALKKLAADPNDGVAWRSAVGLGDAVARSAAIDRLRRAVDQAEGFAGGGDGSDVGAGSDGGAWSDGQTSRVSSNGSVSSDVAGNSGSTWNDVNANSKTRDTISDDTSGKVCSISSDAASSKTGTGQKLLHNTDSKTGAGQEPLRLPEALKLLDTGKITGDALTQPLYDDLLQAYHQVLSDLKSAQAYDDAQTGRAKLAEAHSAPESKPVILVAAPEQIVGQRFDTVLFGGFVNGLIPCRAYFDPVGLAGNAREREWTRCVRLFRSMQDCARKHITLTGFTTCTLQAAETMDVHIESIKLRQGVRTAKTQPSALLKEQEGTLPSADPHNPAS